MSIMLVKFEDGQFYYLAPKDIKIGDKIQNGPDAEIKIGVWQKTYLLV